jgi:hypothetical protein
MTSPLISVRSLLLIVVAIAAFAKQHEYETAELIEVTQTKSGTEYVLASERCVYVALLTGTGRRPKVAAGDGVRFATENRYLYVVDQEGPTLKLRFLSQAMQPVVAPPAR